MEITDFSKYLIPDGKEIEEESFARLVSSSPMCAQINGGEKEIKLECGKTTALKVKVAPWEKIAGKARFYSSNEGVAVVDQKGTVTGMGSGKAKIYAYYANTGVSASVDVSVSAQGGDQPPSGTAKPQASAATKKLTAKKSSTVIAPGKSKKIAYAAKADSSAAKAAPVTVSVSGNQKVTAKIAGSKVKIAVKKKAVRGSAATVTLKSQNAAGKSVKATIKVKVQNKAKKVTAAKKSITVKKGKKAKLVLKVTAQNKKKATTDAVKVSSSLVKIAKKSCKKGKITLTLKGKKKGSKKITVKVGSKKVKVKAKVR